MNLTSNMNDTSNYFSYENFDSDTNRRKNNTTLPCAHCLKVIIIKKKILSILCVGKNRKEYSWCFGGEGGGGETMGRKNEKRLPSGNKKKKETYNIRLSFVLLHSKSPFFFDFFSF